MNERFHCFLKLLKHFTNSKTLVVRSLFKDSLRSFCRTSANRYFGVLSICQRLIYSLADALVNRKHEQDNSLYCVLEKEKQKNIAFRKFTLAFVLVFSLLNLLIFVLYLLFFQP